jgi:hypothetical protein
VAACVSASVAAGLCGAAPLAALGRLAPAGANVVLLVTEGAAANPAV